MFNRSLKLWFVLRTYGITGLQKYIRHHCQLAKRFERLVRSDNKYEILNDVKVKLSSNYIKINFISWLY